MFSWPTTRPVRSVRMRPRSSFGRSIAATSGFGRVPTVETIVRVGMRSPFESVTSFGVANSTRVFVRTSTPSSRMCASPYSTSFGWLP